MTYTLAVIIQIFNIMLSHVSFQQGRYEIIIIH